ncbi:MAG: hypothetical protein H0T45_13430 [Pyrinomonadaceae bacterium]|nr:hypothetical protein [Pyrinomonadaceae bacterium]MDQ3135566.1 hypothetical protein [Acidobacteriota bacterium]
MLLHFGDAGRLLLAAGAVNSEEQSRGDVHKAVGGSGVAQGEARTIYFSSPKLMVSNL